VAGVTVGAELDAPDAAGLRMSPKNGASMMSALSIGKDVSLYARGSCTFAVAPTPDFYSWSFASMWTPGPFESKPTRAYYYLTDVDPSWPAARQDEHLLSPDVDVVGVRRLIRRAFVAPISDHKRVEISKAALLYPL